MIIYIICSVLFWIAAVVLSFVNGMGYCCANAENINGLEEKPKRERKRKVKNPLRR